MAQLEYYTLILATISYFVASVLYAGQFLFTRGSITSTSISLSANSSAVTNTNIPYLWSNVATALTTLGFLINTSTLGIRYYRSGYPPLTNMYEFLLFFVWGIVLFYLYIEFRYKLSQLGMFTLPLVFAMMFWVLFMDMSIRPLMPALRSNWLYFHVLTAVISYGAFALSFVLGIMYLLKDWGQKQKDTPLVLKAIPPFTLLEDLTYKLILVGITFLTLVIVTGAIWAEIAWSSYWSWDPKETWSLITWFIYAGFLHTRLLGNWRGKPSMVLAIIGFLAVIFTFAGVNFLLPGLHSYAFIYKNPYHI